MNKKIIIARSKPNYITMFVTLGMFFYFYNRLLDDRIITAIFSLVVGIVGTVHTILLLTTPLLTHEDENLLIKPKIPFERKVVFISDIVEFKALSDFTLMIVLKNGEKIKLDMGGFKPKEIADARKYLQSLLTNE